MTWVIAYDITTNRRRSRVSKLLAAKGIRIQKSVFLVEAASRAVDQLVCQLAANIDPETDRVCAWPLTEAWRDQQMVHPPEAAPLQEVFVVA